MRLTAPSAVPPEPARATGRVEFADALRGVAALAVLVYHYCGLFWVERATVARLTLASAPLAEAQPSPGFAAAILDPALPNLGAFGVGIFFILSGFVIPFGLGVGRRGFAVDRLLRIVPTYAMGLTLTLAALAWSAHRFGTAWPYSPAQIALHYVPGLRDLADAPSIDGVIWTLEIEVKFYLLCLLLQPWLRDKTPAALLVPIALGGVLLLLDASVAHWFGGAPLLVRLALVYLRSVPYMMLLFAGVALHYRHVGALSACATIGTIAALALIWCVHWWGGPTAMPASAMLGYALALAVFVLAPLAPRWRAAGRVLAALAALSYPLYAVHGVAGYVLLRALGDRGVPAALALPIAIGAALAVALLVHRLIERPTHRLGKRIARSIGARKSPNPATSPKSEADPPWR